MAIGAMVVELKVMDDDGLVSARPGAQERMCRRSLLVGAHDNHLDMESAGAVVGERWNGEVGACRSRDILCHLCLGHAPVRPAHAAGWCQCSCLAFVLALSDAGLPRQPFRHRSVREISEDDAWTRIVSAVYLLLY